MQCSSIIRMSLLLICFCSTLFAKYDVSICAIFQNEAPYLKEWIEFHKLQGIKHFYLYNNNSTDDYKKVLNPYLKSKEVTLVKWPYKYHRADHHQWIRIQSAAYMHCIKQYGSQTKWLAVIDIDEFLFCPSGKALPDFLKKFSRYPGVCVNWLMFGTSFVEEVPKNKTMIETLVNCAKPTHQMNHRIKSIVQPKYVKRCRSAHFFEYKLGKTAVTADKHRIGNGRMDSSEILLDDIRINHYWSRTEKFFRKKKIKGRQKRRKGYPDERMEKMLESYNQSYDNAIQKFVPKLRKALGFKK